MTEQRTALNILILICGSICHIFSDRAGSDGIDDEQITQFPDTHQTRNDTNYKIETLYTRDVTRETRPTAHRSHFRQQMEMEMVLQARDGGSQTSPLTTR